jgi:hypothetical protein
VTNKRFPGDPKRSYGSREPLLGVGEVTGWMPAATNRPGGVVPGSRTGSKSSKVAPEWESWMAYFSPAGRLLRSTLLGCANAMRRTSGTSSGIAGQRLRVAMGLAWGKSTQRQSGWFRLQLQRQAQHHS